MPMVFYLPPASQVQPQSTSNKQGRDERAVDENLYAEAVQVWSAGRHSAQESYEWLTSRGVARELARIDLPLSTYTQWYWKVDLHNLLRFLSLRIDEHAQWEIREYALVIARLLKRVAPLSFEAWVDYDLKGARFSRIELNVLRELVSVRQSTGVSSADSKYIDRSELIDLGLSDREVTEFLVKLSLGKDVEHTFDLDFSKAKSAEYFENRFKENRN